MKSIAWLSSPRSLSEVTSCSGSLNSLLGVGAGLGPGGELAVHGARLESMRKESPGQGCARGGCKGGVQGWCARARVPDLLTYLVTTLTYFDARPLVAPMPARGMQGAPRAPSPALTHPPARRSRTHMAMRSRQRPPHALRRRLPTPASRLLTSCTPQPAPGCVPHAGTVRALKVPHPLSGRDRRWSYRPC